MEENTTVNSHFRTNDTINKQTGETDSFTEAMSHIMYKIGKSFMKNFVIMQKKNVEFRQETLVF